MNVRWLLCLSMRRPQRRSRAARRGITLVEVLISIFILAIGLLGALALVPVAQYRLNEAHKLDRAAALGRSAVREAQVRGWSRPKMWLFANGNPVVQPTGELTPGGLAAPLGPIIIDPLGVATASAVVPLFVPTPGGAYGAPLAPPPAIPRLTLRRWPFVGAPGLDLSLADELFRSSDDVLYAVPGSTESSSYLVVPPPPPPVVLGVNGGAAAIGPLPTTRESRPFPNLLVSGGASPLPIARQSQGEYSWLLTLTPDLYEQTTNPTVYGAGLTGSYTLWATVFYQRSLVFDGADDPPPERNVLIDFVGTGLGGGDVVLRAPYANVPTANWLNLRPGQWIFITGWRQPTPLSPPTPIPFAAWYRVAAVTDVDVTSNPAEAQRSVTLDGPDQNLPNPLGLPFRLLDADTSTAQITAYATIIDGAVGAYYKTIQLEDLPPPGVPLP